MTKTSYLLKLLLLFIIITNYSGCIAKRVVIPNNLENPKIIADFKNITLYLESYKIVGLSEKDKIEAINANKQIFLNYLSSQLKFKNIVDITNRAVEKYINSQSSIFLDVKIVADLLTSRTYCCDAVTAYPGIGLFPITPSWGKAKLSASINVKTGDYNIQRLFSENSSHYSMIFYSWYRTNEIEKAYKKGYKNLFIDIAKKFSDSKDIIVSGVNSYNYKFASKSIDSRQLENNINKENNIIPEKEKKTESEKEKETVVVYDLVIKGKVLTENEASTLSRRIRSVISQSGKYLLIGRDEMMENIKGFLDSNNFNDEVMCSEDSCMVEVAGALGANKIIAGTVDKIGDTITFDMYMKDLLTKRISYSATEDCSNCKVEDLLSIIEKAAKKIVE